MAIDALYSKAKFENSSGSEVIKLDLVRAVIAELFDGENFMGLFVVLSRAVSVTVFKAEASCLSIF